MHDHNLDDLIIDNIEPKNKKTKSFLTIIALLIIVLIVAIILTKTLLTSTDSNEIVLEEESTEVIAPELRLQEATSKATTAQKVEKTEDALSLSNIIEQKIKEPVAHPQKPKSIEKPKPITTPVPVKKEEKIEEVMKETVTITKEYTQIPQQVEKPVKVTEVPKPKKVEAVKKAEETKKELVIPKPVVPPKPVSAITYYIQVGSFSQNPSSRFLSVIKNSGFHYKITKPSAKGIKKLLIGPYKSRASVDTALVRVRDRINKSAFVGKK
jgi:DedD protein